MTAELAIDLDRSSPIPLYFQVAEQISEAIRRGDLIPGSRLDNEILLADRLGLSRPTVRQAIQYLVDKGLLVRKRGVGTQVVHGQVKRSVELTSLYDDLRGAGQSPPPGCCPWSARRSRRTSPRSSGSRSARRCCAWSGSAMPPASRWR